MAQTASQQYDIWIQAVGTALKTSGRGFGVSQIDPSAAHAAFISGVSPVVFARQAQPMPKPHQVGPLVAFSRQSVMLPNGGVIRWSCIFLTINGWLFWLFGALSLMFAVYTALTIAATGATAAVTRDEEMRRAALSLGLFGVPATILQILFSLFIFVLGSVWHWLAQHLAIVYHQYDSRHRTLP